MNFQNKNIKLYAHTQEKLDAINYYYKTWFKIVKSQKAYIIDAFAGTGYVEIENNDKKVYGSALIAVDLLKKDTNNNLNLLFTNINKTECEILGKNVIECISKKEFGKECSSRVQIIEGDWYDSFSRISMSIQDGISLFLLDPYGIDSMPWNKVEYLIKRGKSEFGYKESGFEVLINWAWHAIRRQIGKYFNEEDYERTSLDNFFSPLDWRNIVGKYPKNIFRDNLDIEIEKLRERLLFAYVRSFFKYFKYVKIHDVYRRKKSKENYYKERGKVVYCLIFASNYSDALDIIDVKFKQYRDTKIYFTLPKGQETLSKFVPMREEKDVKENVEKININIKIKKVEEDLGDKLYSKSKEIIKFLYKRKNYDYGCIDFALLKEFNINEGTYLPYLLRNNIIKFRSRRSKKGNVGKFYYISHPRLVDRSEYLFFNDNRYIFEEEEFKKF